MKERKKRKKKKKNPAPGGIRTLDLKSHAPQECALPLCYNHGPMKHKGSINASHPAFPGSDLGSSEVFERLSLVEILFLLVS